MEKTNAMNLNSGRDAALIAAGYALLPTEFCAKLSAASFVLAALYLLKDRIPKDA